MEKEKKTNTAQRKLQRITKMDKNIRKLVTVELLRHITDRQVIAD